jgi:tetratricopeptide (TPR) repeat protein
VSTPLASWHADAARLHREGRLVEAAQYYQRVLDLAPDDPEALYRLAQIACQQGLVADGLAHVERALAAEPHRGRTHVLRGMALARLGRLQDALSSFDRAIACEPGQADAYGCRGDVLSELGHAGDAITSYDQALVLKPAVAENWCNRGAALASLGRHEDALASFERAAAVDAGFAEAHFNRGNMLALLWRHQEAVAAFTQALAVNPHLADALNNRASALRTLGRREEALADLERAIAIAPAHIEALVSRGALLLASGRSDDALASCEQALARKPNHLAALLHSSNALAELGRLQEALKRIEAARSLAPLDANIAARADLLRKIGTQPPAAFYPPVEWLVQRHGEVARRSGSPEKPTPDFTVTEHRIAYAPQNGVMEIPNAVVLAGEWQVLHHEQVLCDGVNQTPFPPISAYHVAKLPPQRWLLAYPEARSLPVAAAFMLGGCPNYGHWLMDYLPRIALWQGDVPLLVNSPLLPFQSESLANVGARPDQLLRLDYPGAYRVPMLLYPSLQSLWCDPRLPFQASIITWLRERFAALMAPQPRGRKLFVTRQGATRRLLNGDEIERIAEQFGFELVACETLSFGEQARLFSEARIIAGAHGAGLVNMVFAPPGTQVIELIGPRYAQDQTGGPFVYLRMAAVLGQHFIRVVGHTDLAVAPALDRLANEAFTIQANDFCRALDRCRVPA